MIICVFLCKDQILARLVSTILLYINRIEMEVDDPKQNEKLQGKISIQSTIYSKEKVFQMTRKCKLMCQQHW